MSLTIYDEHVRGPAAAGDAGDTLVLPFERRQIARQRAVLESGREIGIVLPRGTVLRGGDLLRRSGGRAAAVVAVVAADEDVSTVHCDDRRRLARIAYHLGNRHVSLEVGDGWVRYLRDHVLDDMVRGLGAEVAHETAPFEPEAGAYAHGHGHGHDPGHDHHPGHSHSHSHSHSHGDSHAHGHGHGHGHGQSQSHSPTRGNGDVHRRHDAGVR